MRRWLYHKGAGPVEAAFTAGWSVGEVLYALRRPGDLLRDRLRSRVLDEVAERGLYREWPGEEQALEIRRGGWIVLKNPYRYLNDLPPDRIVARLEGYERPGPRPRHLLIMCHCYGLPLPRVMGSYFGLRELEGYDVVYNIMNRHYRGSFGAWPGFGLMSMRLSQVIEVIQSSITGVRALIRSLRAAWGYETVSVLGYSIGGQLALHLGNHLALRRLIAYCPVTHVHRTFQELGWMPQIGPPVQRVVKAVRADFDPDDLRCLDPLQPRYALQIDERDVLVVVQANDRMVPPAQIEPIRARYPNVQWCEFQGTHTFPDDHGALVGLIRRTLSVQGGGS